MSGVRFIIPAKTEHIALSLAAPMEIFAHFSKKRLDKCRFILYYLVRFFAAAFCGEGGDYTIKVMGK